VHRQFGLQAGKYVLYAGRLTRDKAPHDLIRAFCTLDTDCKLVVAGESRYDDAYDRELAALAAGSTTIFTGRLAPQHLRELMSNAQVFVLPSHVEGRSMALMEALAHRTLVLVSDIRENREVVTHERSTFRAGDVADLAAKLSYLLACRDDEANLLRLELARNVGAGWTWDDVASAYERLYRAALEPARPRKLL
jgi:glycosyltransferase involved in cell wall biosynthesis